MDNLISIFRHQGQWLFNRVFSLFAAFYSFMPRQFFTTAQHGLDPSWAMAINRAVKEKLLFGTQFVFTYGPLGYLQTGLPLWVQAWPIVFFRLFLWGALIYISLRIIQHLQGWTESFLLAICFFYAGQFGAGDTGMVLLLFFIAMGLSQQPVQWIGWVIMIILVALAFYIKINTGFVAILLLYGIAAVQWRLGNLRFSALLIIPGLSLLAIIALSFPLNVSLFPYVTYGMEIISGFQDTMILDSWYAFTGIYAVIILGIAASILFYSFKADPLPHAWSLFRASMIAGFCWLLYKQGFIRADQHQYVFFGLASLALCLFAAQLPEKTSLAPIRPLLLFAFLFSIIGIHQVGVTQLQFRPHWTAPDRNLPARAIPDSFRLKERVGTAPIDIFPFDISYLLADGFNYRPRPVPQSYSAYTARLDALNAAHMQSSNAPEYVLFCNKTIIFQNAGWDETQTRLSLLSHYKVIDSLYIPEASEKERLDTFLLLKKRPVPLTQTRMLLQNGQAKLNETILIPESDQILLLKADLQYSFWNRLKKAWLKPDIARVELTYANGETEIINAPLPIKKEGVMIQTRLSRQKDARALFLGDGEQQDRVVSIRIIASEKDFNPSLNISFEQLQTGKD